MRISAPLNTDFEPALQWMEVASFFQIPSFHIIGLPAPEVAEARERIHAAVDASGLDFPKRRIVINLSPASVRKSGTGLDLAMALAVLTATEKSERLPGKIVVAWGELGLDGTVKPAGQLTRLSCAACFSSADILVVAEEEAAAVRERLDWLARSLTVSSTVLRIPRVLAVRNLAQAWKELDPKILDAQAQHEGVILPSPRSGTEARQASTPQLLPLDLALGRTLGIAAAGRHHLLLLGPRGTGKSHALEWLEAIQPPMSLRARIENELLTELNLSAEPAADRVIRRVGTQARPAALLGTVQPGFVRPGELSLAHGGLLIADELPEWPRDSRELLREPLQDGFLTLTRARCSVRLPARFTLAATGNFCPCGGWPPEIPIPLSYLEEAVKPPRCDCGLGARKKYIAKLSGPILDRIDMVGVATYSRKRARPKKNRTPLQYIELQEQVDSVQERAKKSWGCAPGLLGGAELESMLKENPSWKADLDQQSPASLRSRHKILRLAMTIAIWEGKCAPGPEEFAEAPVYRPEFFGLCE